MNRHQPNRAAAVLAAALGVAVVVCRALLRRDTAAWILYVSCGLTAVLAVACLICVFMINNKKPVDTEQKGEGHGQ